MTTSATMRPPTGPEVQAVLDQLRFFQHVVPERRRAARSRARAPELVQVRRCPAAARPSRWAMACPDGSSQVMCRSRLRCGQRRSAARWQAIAPSGRLKSGVESLRVDPLVGLDLAVAEVEERLPADEAARRAAAAAQVGGVRLPGRCERIEDEAEERIAVVAGEVRPVRRAHHAVAEAVGGALELDRDEGLALARPVEPAARVAARRSTIACPTNSGRNSCRIIHW